MTDIRRYLTSTPLVIKVIIDRMKILWIHKNVNTKTCEALEKDRVEIGEIEENGNKYIGT